MINTIIFDFGNVFINLDIEGAIIKSLARLKIREFPSDILCCNKDYEQGLISTYEFLEFYKKQFNHLSEKELINLWNSLIMDFPKYRLQFLKKLKATKNYKLILLSNTNQLHINHIKKQVTFYEEFKNYFDAFYLSHEINLRKPTKAIFQFIIDENNLNPKNCMFIDDNADNIKTADSMYFKTWHIQPNQEDVITLFKTCKHLF